MQIEIEISVDFNMLEKITFELLAAHVLLWGERTIKVRAGRCAHQRMDLNHESPESEICSIRGRGFQFAIKPIDLLSPKLTQDCVQLATSNWCRTERLLASEISAAICMSTFPV